MQVGQIIGNYKITAKLGEGGMGVVYLAEHPVIGRKVAMKAIHPELSRNPEVVSRFMTEAKSVNQIGNDHIVDISDFGTTTEGEFYFIMEFLQGESLADRLKHQHLLAPPLALQIAAQVADALAASHAHGIIHRDLKPENIFLINRGGIPDFVKVLDFGLAKLTQGEEKVSHKTRTGSVMGTPYYMAPEQCEGKANIDHRADLYSLGIILFEMLTGKVPFGGEGYGEIIVKHMTMPPPSPRAINPMVTAAQEAVVARALTKNRDDRFPSMTEFREAILDPERYAKNAPALPVRAPGSAYADTQGATPGQMGDDGASGQIVFGANPALGARSSPMPSTFRENAGELLGGEAQLPRSRKGLIAGTLGAVIVAGAAALFFTHKSAPVEPTRAPVAAAPVPVPTPAPATVKVAFTSEPAGATVSRVDTGKIVGTTPFDLELAHGTAPVEFVFKKESFEETRATVVPDSPGQLTAALKGEAAPAQPIAAEATRKPAARSSSGKTSGGKNHAAKTGHKPGGKPIDEDGVLEPSFK